MGGFASKYFPVELDMIQTCRLNNVEGVWGR